MKVKFGDCGGRQNRANHLLRADRVSWRPQHSMNVDRVPLDARLALHSFHGNEPPLAEELLGLKLTLGALDSVSALPPCPWKSVLSGPFHRCGKCGSERAP